MAHSLQEALAQLEDKMILGEILESDYKQLKWQLMRQLRDSGQTLQSTIQGSIQRAEVVDSNGTTFCYIPAEPFMYGADNDFSEVVASFYISKYPVTVREFTAFLEQSGYDYPEEDLEQMYLVSPDPDCPVSHVSWDDAKAYCRWMRKKTCEYYSLPSELEWEKAARGIDGRYYPWGNAEPNATLACFQGGMTYNCTVPVDTFEGNRSPHGVMDMVGNVWEWCVDEVDDPRDPHILRGGSWCNNMDYSNCIARTFSHPSSKRIDFGGFRPIYLPHDMLIEYRKSNDPESVPKKKLKVIRMEGEVALPEELEGGGDGSELTAALDAAVQRAAAQQAGSAPSPAPSPPPPPPANEDDDAKPRSAVATDIRDELIAKLKRKPGQPSSQPSTPKPMPNVNLATGPVRKSSAKPASPAMEIITPGAEYDDEEEMEAIGNASAKLLRKKATSSGGGDSGDGVTKTVKSKPLLEVEGFETEEEDEESIKAALAEMAPTSVTYAMFGLWSVLLLSVLVMTAIRVAKL